MPRLKSPVSYLSDGAYSALPRRERWLIAASSYVGCHEVGGNNHGPMVAEFLRSVELGEGNPWCAAFVTYCAGVAGIDPTEVAPRRQLAAVSTWMRVAQERDAWRPKAPKRGDLFFWVNQLGQGHIGFVVAPNDADGDFFRTIEGNTNDAGGRDGDAVARKVRSLDQIRASSGYRGFEHKRSGFVDVDRLLPIAGR